ncbi:antirestriction protein ArdA [Gordonia sp. 1D]|uniref:antirestriction protein ArdA n=1 Tax=Gordonia sp. 1D TaxID=1737359 RepID=UPI000BB6999C|nr:antirestriction protein ArdA [Gordonia sp. 1D]ATD71734.1 antirestriction protein [Gordonia sp. 1D]
MTTTHSRPTIDEPRVWIGCLACYNDGRLRGDWFSAAEAADVTPRQIHGGRATSHEELWVFDHDNIPVDGEFAPMDATGWAEVYDEVGETQWPAICAWVRSGSYVAQGDTDLPVVSHFEERFRGEWDSFRDYAFELAEDLVMFDGLDDDHTLVRYFNWDSWISDLEGDYVVERAPGGGVYVFAAL